MWESRVLGEISKSVWKPFCGFHRDVISIAVFVIVRRDDARRQSYTNGLLRDLLCAQVGVDFGAPAPRSAFEDVRVMEQPIEERRDGGGVTQ